MTSFDFESLNKEFKADIWLSEHFGCEFILGQNGWLNCGCPFDDHADNSPSFGINNDLGAFKCFGCGKSGTYIKLLSSLLKIDTVEAIKIISDASGFDLSTLDTFEHKNEKLKLVLEEKDQEKEKRDKLILKATIKIKKIMEKDFELAENYFKELDEIVVQNNRQLLREFVHERIK